MKTLIRTYSDDIYIIADKTPEQVQQACIGVEWLKMPNGDMIRPASISAIQSYESYTFQANQKIQHKKGHYLKKGEWHDYNGPLGINAKLENITGNLLQLAPPKK